MFPVHRARLNLPVPTASPAPQPPWGPALLSDLAPLPPPTQPRFLIFQQDSKYSGLAR